MNNKVDMKKKTAVDNTSIVLQYTPFTMGEARNEHRPSNTPSEANNAPKKNKIRGKKRTKTKNQNLYDFYHETTFTQFYCFVHNNIIFLNNK